MQSWVRHISVLKPFIVNRTVECSVEKWPCRRLIEISTFNVHAQSLSHVQLLGHLMDCSPPGSSVHGIFQARILECVAISFSRGSSQPRDQTCVSQIGRPILYHWATREAQIEVHNLFSSVQSFSRVSLFVTPWTAARQTSLSIINSQSLLKLNVHHISDAVQPFHPLLSHSPTFNLSQHQGLFKWVSSLHQVAKVLEFQLQHQSFQWIFRTDFL